MNFQRDRVGDVLMDFTAQTIWEGVRQFGGVASYVIVMLSGIAFKVLRDYKEQLRYGNGPPTFTRGDLSRELPVESWDSAERPVSQQA